MTVYVDEIRKHPTGPLCFRDGACHMLADSLDELHAMASTIGLKRAWFQDHPRHPHYDLTAAKRSAALKAGAVFKPAKARARDRPHRS